MGKKTNLECRAFKDQVATGNHVSSTIDISGIDTLSFHYVWSGGVGTPVGAFTYEISNDNSNWVSLAHAPAASQSGDTGQFFSQATGISTSTNSHIAAKYVRVRFILSSGTSVIINAYLFGKSMSS